MKTRFPSWVIAVATAVTSQWLWSAGEARPAEPERLKPIGEAQGIHPGRVVWVHDPEVTDWKGPGDGHWWEGNRTTQERVDQMMSRAIRELTGESTDAKAWE